MIDPLPPEFDFQSDIILINGIISTSVGSSNVTVEKTLIEFGEYTSKFISDCEVLLINSKTKEKIIFFEQDNIYLPPSDFKIIPRINLGARGYSS